MSNPVSDVWLELDLREADALSFAADYLAGFGRVAELLDDARFPASDLRDVVRTLRALHARVAARAEAA